MSTASSSAPRDGVAAALRDVRRVAARGGDELLRHVPDTGDLVTGRIVDEFVEQASDALRGLAQSIGETLLLVEDPAAGAVARGPAEDPGAGA